MADRKVKVVSGRHFNIVHLMFLVIFIYMIIAVAKYVSKEEIRVDTVVEGSLVQNHNYTGLILRNESVLTTDQEGYIKCYIVEGERISKDGTVFAIDKTGDHINNNGSSLNEISSDQYQALRKYMNNFEVSFSGQNYEDVYNLKNQLNSVLYSIEQKELGDGENSVLDFVKSDSSGTVFYSIDGYEDVKADQVTRENLKKIVTENSKIVNGEKVEAGQPICRVIYGEEWYVLLPITDEDYSYYEGKEKATVFLADINQSLNTEIEVYTDSNGEKIAKITLDRFVSSFAKDRMISIRLEKPVKTGLKVAKSSIVSNDLFVIPKEYGRRPENGSSTVFYRKSNKDNGAEAFTPSISYADDTFYYLEDGEVDKGDEILLADDKGNIQEDSFIISEKKTLRGVYKVNKGYAVFAVVSIIDENDSYCIVQGGTNYGLSVYDHIVLNASTVSEDDLLY